MTGTLVRPAMAVVRNSSAHLSPRRGAHERGSLGPPDLAIGPPVNWNLCLKCMKEMSPSEERYRAEVEGPNGTEVGVGHRECEGLGVS